MNGSVVATHQKTRLQRLLRLRGCESLSSKGARRHGTSVTAPHRNRDLPRNDVSRNRIRGYASERLQRHGYAQTLTHKGTQGCVTAVTAVTAKKHNVRKFSGGAR